jgi:hypothetical protein
MRRKAEPQKHYKFARDTVSVREPGSKYPTTVRKGTAWHADCPMVAAHPDLFADEPPEVNPRGWSPPPVEQATAAPGEVRDSVRGD